MRGNTNKYLVIAALLLSGTPAASAHASEPNGAIPQVSAPSQGDGSSMLDGHDAKPVDRSVVIADMSGSPRFREDLVVAPTEGETPESHAVDETFNSIYEADFRIRRVLSGPPIGPKLKILFIGNHIDRWSDVRLFMVVGHDKFGDPWAGHNWRKVTGRVCLDGDTIRYLAVDHAFQAAKADRDGSLCISS
jgi:hypothetical protein